MPPTKLPTSVLAALGLLGVAACDGGEGETGPCLDFAVDTGDFGDTDSDSDSDTGPCLDIPADSGSNSATPEESRQAPKLSSNLAGVLPADVARLLEARRETPK